MKIAISVCAFILLTQANNFAGTFWNKPPKNDVEILVTDAEKKPLAGVLVKVGGGLEIERYKDSRDRGYTDASGTVRFSLRNVGRVTILVEEKGYYDVWLRDQPIDATAKVSRHEVNLQPIINPIPLYVRINKILTLPVLDEAVGYDMEKGDWVAPYGEGIHNDMMFFGRNQFEGTFDFDVEVNVMFENPHDGIQEAEVIRGSSLRVSHLAPEQGYEPSLKKWVRRMLKGQREANFVYENGSCFFIRTRTKVDEVGNIISANYGKIYNDIKISPRGATAIDIQFTYYFNPTPNDRNLEFDIERNLAKDERLRAQYH